MTIEDTPISSEQLGDIIDLISSNEISGNHIFAKDLSSNNATITTLGSTDINTTNVTATGDIIIGATNVLSKLNTNANSVSILEPNCLNKIKKKIIYVYVRAKSGENPYYSQGSTSCYYFKTDGIEFESPILQLTAGVTYRFNQERAREPYQRLGFMSDILSRTPSMSQTMLQTPQPYTNPLLGAIGTGITGLQAYGGMTGN